MSYPWPGNIRELKNVVNRACVLAQGDRIVLKDISLPVDVPLRMTTDWIWSGLSWKP